MLGLLSKKPNCSEGGHNSLYPIEVIYCSAIPLTPCQAHLLPAESPRAVRDEAPQYPEPPARVSNHRSAFCDLRLYACLKVFPVLEHGPVVMLSSRSNVPSQAPHACSRI